MNGYWINNRYYADAGFSVSLYSETDNPYKEYQPKGALKSLVAYGEQDRILTDSKILFKKINNISNKNESNTIS